MSSSGVVVNYSKNIAASPALGSTQPLLQPSHNTDNNYMYSTATLPVRPVLLRANLPAATGVERTPKIPGMSCQCQHVLFTRAGGRVDQSWPLSFLLLLFCFPPPTGHERSDATGSSRQQQGESRRMLLGHGSRLSRSLQYCFSRAAICDPDRENPAGNNTLIGGS